MTVQVSIPLEEDQLARIGAIAAAKDETAAEVLAEAIAAYLDDEDWYTRRVDHGIWSAENGDRHDLEDLARELRARRRLVNAFSHLS